MNQHRSAEEALTEYTPPGLHASLAPRLATIPRDAAVLDIGCATGAWLLRLADAGFTRLSGVDRDMSYYRGPTVRLAKVDLDAGEDIPFEERSFRLITALEVIEHLESPGRLLDQLERLLAPDGVALLTTPNLESTAARIRFLAKGSAPSFDERSDPTHVFPVLRRCLDTMLARRGLEVVESWGYPASGSVVFRPPVMWLARCLWFLPETARGDNHCMLIARREPAPRSTPKA